MRNIIISALLFGVYLNTLMATEGYSLNSYKIKISGTSSVHDWVVHCNNVSASALFVLESGKLKEVKSMYVDITGNSLKSERQSKSMDKKMYDALQVIQFPNITYKLNHVASYPSLSNGNVLNAVGVLTIAGINKEESLQVNTKVNGDGSIIFTGEKKINMADYKIKPPTAMMGAITVGQEVTISFELIMNKNH